MKAENVKTSFPYVLYFNNPCTKMEKLSWFDTYNCVPITQLGDFRALMKSIGQKVNIKFRGPRRPHSEVGYLGRSVCLKKDATHFTAYLIVENHV